MPVNPNVDAVLRSIEIAESHIRSEYVHDLAGTMATVGPHPRYAVTTGPGQIGVIAGRDGVAALYEGAHEWAIPQASRFLTQICTDWYVFVENMPTRKWVADASMRTVHTATLIVADTQGIKGEFVWERLQGERRGVTDGALPLGSLASVTLHENYIAALSAGDTAKLRTFVADNAVWAERDSTSDEEGGAIVHLTDADSIVARLARWHEETRPQRVSVLNRQVTEWYVFAEELWTLAAGDGQLRQMRKAVIYPVTAGGQLGGALGWQTELEPASAQNDASFGQAFWPEPDESRSSKLQLRTLSSMAI
jgi:hypothetical protein